jgi:signal transduction histidine kinase
VLVASRGNGVDERGRAGELWKTLWTRVRRSYSPACRYAIVPSVSVSADVRHRPWNAYRSPRMWIEAGFAHYALEVGLLAGLYYGAAKLGYALDFAGPVAAIVWLPVGVGISFLYLRGLQFWPGMLIGDLLANNYTALPIGSALGQTVGNVLEVTLAAFVLRRLGRRVDLLGSVTGVAQMLLPLAVATTVSATIGAFSLRLGGVVTTHAIPTVWRTWWLGDACGAFVVVPLALAWARPLQPGPRRRYAEAALMLAAVAGLAELSSRSPRSLVYLVFPGLIWAALRFGQRGATLAVLIVVGFTIWNTTHLDGPFHYHSITRTVLSTQLFLTVAAISALYLAAVVSERETYAERLGASRARMLRAADAERRRIERNLHDGAQQRLLALAVHLRLAAERVESAPDDATQLIEAAEGELQVAFDELRELSQGIHPTVLTDLGLATAIRSVAARSIQPIALLELPASRVDGTAEGIAYFVFTEAVTNAQKHASASTIGVRAWVADGTLRIEVSDDGEGGAAERSGSGLSGLRDRVEDYGGTFSVDSVAGRGTRVSAQLPLAARGAT